MIKPFSMEYTNSNNTNMIIHNNTQQSIVGLDFSSLQNISNPIMSFTSDSQSEKKKRGRPSKKSNNQPLFTSPPHMGNIITDDMSGDNSKRELNFLETNDPYENKYIETNMILKSAIAQLDAGIIDLQHDIDDIRSAKTLRNKFTNLANLQGNMGMYIGNKISAARELNNTITKCNELELRRYKEIKSSSINDKDDDQKIMEMYKAFINVPVGNNTYNPGGMSPLGPSIQDMTLPSQNLMGNNIGTADMQFQNYIQNLTPAQNTMLLENDPNVKQVVVYNQETGARYFEVMNMITGETIPNADKHDQMFMEDVTIDQKNGVARNINLGETYPLVVVGQPIINEY